MHKYFTYTKEELVNELINTERELDTLLEKIKKIEEIIKDKED